MDPDIFLWVSAVWSIFMMVMNVLGRTSRLP